MRRWRCISVNYGNRNAFTVGKIYETDDKGYGVIIDNGNIMDCVSLIKEMKNNYQLQFEEVIDKKEEKKVNKFKVGDRVRIIREKCGHEFKMGEVVIIREVYKKDYKAFSLDGYKSWFVTDDEIELVKYENDKSKSITITTSDTITTLTNGNHTTTINRYYKDKNDEKIAVNEVVKKYYDELEEINRVSKIPKVGDKVRVVDSGLTHSTYDKWLIKNNVDLKSAINWKYGLSPKNGEIYTVKVIDKHDYFGYNIALIEDIGSAFIVGLKGLEVVK
jgi:hypothetical protein